MRIAALFAAIAGFAVANLQAQTTNDYPALKTEAEKLFTDRSFAKAHDVYEKARALELSAADSRWVDFRLADTLWRSQAATQTADNTQLENAVHQLDALVRDLPRVEDHDRVWVEVKESLGDYFWTRANSQNWGGAWQHYQPVLDWWAGAADIEVARERYLKIVWKCARPPQYGPRPVPYTYYGNTLPLDVLENALKIAQTENDKAHAHYLIAMTVRNQGGEWDRRQRVPEDFEAAIKPGKSTEWYDDALYNYAEWMLSQGRIIPLKEGGYQQEPDYVKALELFRRIVRDFQRGESRYYQQAQSQIRNITDPVVSVNINNVFLPDSEIQYNLNWRNVKRVDLALYAVDLTRDVGLAGGEERRNDWLQSIDLAGREKVRSWSHETKDKEDYKPGYETLRLEGKLPVGAYILEGRGNGKAARDLILVTDASIVLKTSGKQALVYMCNALDGSPLAEAKFHLWERYFEDNRWQWHDATKTADTNGLAVFDLVRTANSEQIFVGGISSNRQAFSQGNSYYNARNRDDNWKIYATTDRPAYRPKETVQWKFTARQYNGSVYSTPSGQSIEYEIHDPRGTKIKEDKVTLNVFGTVWGSLELTETMPLGEYRVTFWESGRRRTIGNATLFRLEEYKLPEFKVTVQTPEENGHKKSFRVGEKVEVNVQSDYYFGGAVANASVEVVVYQNPFYRTWREPREFPWFYEDSPNNSYRRYYGGPGEIVKRETLKTDATGKAVLSFDTPRNSGQDFEYRIEARVTDSSRREIIGNGSVRATRQRYFVNLQPGHNLYRPQDKVTMSVKAQDANDQPVQTEGIVRVTRDYWFEIWLDPNGREVKGDELKQLREKSLIFPPPPTKPDDRAWQLKFRGYEHDQILTRTLKTDTNGAAELTFTPERDGYYRIAWSSEDTVNTNLLPGAPITADTTVWVATTTSSELGYRQGSVEIIVDKDTFRVGQTAPVMLSVPTNDRYVLFSVEGEDLHSYQLVHVTGSVKLIQLPIEEKHVPNIFLGASLVSDRQIMTDTKEIIVPPSKNFLTVDIKPDREQYQPQQDGTFTVTTADDSGKPVSAEISFGLVDEAVYYIQSDYAGDPRQFYFGQKRPHTVQTQSTFNQKVYVKLVEWEKEQLIDERERDARRRQASARVGDYSEGDYSLLAKDEARADLSSSGVLRQRASGISGFAGGGGARGGRGGGGAFAASEMSSMNASMPMTPAPMAAAKSVGMLMDTPGAGEEPAVQVRSDFRSTIVWMPDVKTGSDGKTTVKVKYPDSLTGWKATARAVSEANQFGICSTNTRTKQPLIVRLQAPRFFLVGDKLTVSAIINNNTESELKVQPQIEAGGVFSHTRFEPAATLTVSANGEARADWVITVTTPGEARLKVTARGGKYSDAMEKTYPVFEHGIEKFISRSGKVRGDDITIKLDLPKERKPGSTLLNVQVSPSMAVTMLDALPYLIDYPYGCTEQTMSRFLPAAITAKTLKDLGLAPEDVMYRAFGGIESNSAAATHPNGKRDLEKLAEIEKAGLDRLYDFQHGDGGWGWWKEGDSDHFMTAYVLWGLALAQDAGIEKEEKRVSSQGRAISLAMGYLDKSLVEEEENYDIQAWMLHALATVKAVNDKIRERNPGPLPLTEFEGKAFTNLWNNREKLNAYTRALLTLSAHHFGKTNEAKTLVENLENGVKIDNAPDTSVVMQGAQQSGPGVIGTAHWGADGIYWRWSDGGVESTAFALRAILAVDPTNKLVEPVCNWLIKNRRGAQWSNTRDTAITVLAMNDYLRASGELSPDFEYELMVNGTSIAKKKLTGREVFNAPSQFAIDPKLIKDGENNVRIVRRGGKGPVYFAANATYFSLEEPIPAAGNEIFVRRQYYKLAGRPTLLKGYIYDRVPLNDGDSIQSGERVETVLTIESKNNYEYLLFEDLKPAGLEAVAIRSGESLMANELKSGAVERKLTSAPPPSASNGGEHVVRQGDTLSRIARDNKTTIAALRQSNPGLTDQIRPGLKIRLPGSRPAPAPALGEDYTGRSRWVYQELRDRKVAMFLDKLPQGVWEIKYSLRAEVPGEFHALPVVGHAMYVPEIRCNGQEVRITVLDTKP